MEIAKRHRPPRLPGYDYSTPGYYFVTFNTVDRGENALSFIRAVVPAPLGGPPVSVVLTPAGEIARQLIENIGHVYPDVSVDCYVIMPDHIHLIIVLGRGDGPPRGAGTTDTPQARTSLGTVINGLKGLVSKRCGPRLWQDGYYDHIIRGDPDLAETRAYIQNNPAVWLETKD